MVKKMINSRTTPFDTYKTIAVSTLKCALNDGSDRDIPVSYIAKFCDMVMNSMWRCVFNTIAGSELYGDADGFIFNMGGYIDAFYDCDGKRWQGFTYGQVERLERSYPLVVKVFQMVGTDIIEHYLRCMFQIDIELAIEYFSFPYRQRPRGTFRNMEYIAYECRDGMYTAEEIYNRFVERARELMNYKNNKKEE
jgi:hypothetical protein